MKYTLANNEPFQVDGAINEAPKSVNVLDLKTSDLTNDSGFLTGYTETDPIFQASAASSITSNDISNWNATKTAVEENELTTAAALTEHENRIDSLEESVAYSSDLDSKMDIINLEEYCPTLLQELAPTMQSGTPVTLSQAALAEYRSLTNIEGKYCIIPSTTGNEMFKLDRFNQGPGTEYHGSTYQLVTYLNDMSYVPSTDNLGTSFDKPELDSIMIVHTYYTDNNLQATENNDYQVITTRKYLQDSLVSGENIKTVNNASLLGSGNVSIPSLYWCTCPTEQATNGVKVINGVGIPTADGRPVPGTTIGVMFEADNTNSTYDGNNISFNVDSTGAIPICYAGFTVNPPQEIALGGAGRVVYYTYKPGTDANDPGVWVWTGHDVDKDTKYNFSTLKIPVKYSNGEYILDGDNTWSTIESAIEAGRNVVLNEGDFIYQLSYYDREEAWFTYTNNSSIQVFVVDGISRVIYNKYSIGTSFYGTCATAATISAKTSYIADWQLKVGNVVSIKFTYNVPASATLNITSTGVKAIYYNGAAIKANIINSGDIATFVYDGTYYQLISVDGQATHPDNYYGICDTAASAVNKISTIEEWHLRKGSIAVIKFANNVPASATLNISSTGAKNIRYKGSNIIADIIAAGDTATFIYDGTYYQLTSIDSPPSSDVELVSGVDVKTINNTSIVGPGNLDISATDPTTITDMTSSTTFSQAMAPNVVYIVGSTSDPVTSFEITSLTSSSNYAEYYHAIIYCDDNMTFTRPSTIKVADDRSIPVFESGHVFEINIFENILTYTYTDLS